MPPHLSLRTSPSAPLPPHQLRYHEIVMFQCESFRFQCEGCSCFRVLSLYLTCSISRNVSVSLSLIKSKSCSSMLDSWKYTGNIPMDDLSDVARSSMSLRTCGKVGRVGRVGKTSGKDEWESGQKAACVCHSVKWKVCIVYIYEYS